MKHFKLIVMIFVCYCLYFTNLYAELQKTPERNSTKQQDEVVLEQIQTEQKFNPAEFFNKIWTIINNEFWDPNFNGVDWEDVRTRYRPKALATNDHESFSVIVNQMLAELKTSHTYYYTKWDPLYYTLQAALISGDLRENNTTDTSVLEKRLPGLYSSQANPHRT